jgi:hypothetical protein
MALSLQLGYPDVPKSITNSYVEKQDALDNSNPIPFLTFIKIINVSFEPDSLQGYYTYYVKAWNKLNSRSEKDNTNSITERYREFIKDISLNYTTNEEKQFLTKIDFNDPYDLDIAIGFYGRKLKELALYYNSKRNDVKFNVVRNKLKGTNFGIERTISELTLSYLKNLDDGKMLYDFDQIKNVLEIQIDELYDTCPFYFNQTPDPNHYDKKDLDYGFNLFLEDDKTTISKHLSAYSENLKVLKETNQLFDNKRKLTQKYLSTDFYYLSTGSNKSQFLSGKLFSTDKPINNFLNRDYPTTVSTEISGYLQSNQSRGFFRPQNTSIVLVDGLNSSFSINLSTISPNSLYFFPDPNVIGVNGDILTFIVDDLHLKNNFSSSNAVNQPSTNQFDTKYNGYVSKIEPNVQKYLDSVFDNGDIKDSKKDIYNNLYGLFKNDSKFGQVITNIDEKTTKSLIFNGHLFYDDVYNEGYGYNWGVIDNTTYKETKRSGISTYTGRFSSINPDLNLYFGRFTPYNDLVKPTDENLVPYQETFEGGYFTKSDYSKYDDSLSSDLSAFSTNTGLFYYTELIDGSVSKISPLTRALLDPLYPTLSGNFTNTPTLTSLNIVDGSRFEIPFSSNFGFSSNSYSYENSTVSPTQFSNPISYDPKFELNGKILIRNSATRAVLPLLDTFPYLNSKFNPSIVSELNSKIVNFEITNDIMVIESQKYLTFNKILFKNGLFQDPKSTSIYLNHSTSPYNKISNRFKVKNDIFYVKLNVNNIFDADYNIIDDTLNNNFIVYPEIYQFDTINFKNKKIFPIFPGDITNYFNIMGNNVKYVKSDTPILSYSSKNNIFNLSFLMKDQNDMVALHGYSFHLNPNVTFLNHVINKSGSSEYSNTFTTENLSTLNVYLSSGFVQTQSETLII